VDAQRFYLRQGFHEVERTDGSRNEEGAPDILYAWNPSRAPPAGWRWRRIPPRARTGAVGTRSGSASLEDDESVLDSSRSAAQSAEQVHSAEVALKRAPAARMPPLAALIARTLLPNIGRTAQPWRLPALIGAQLATDNAADVRHADVIAACHARCDLGKAFDEARSERITEREVGALKHAREPVVGFPSARNDIEVPQPDGVPIDRYSLVIANTRTRCHRARR
jgi:hypothetical protein